MTVVRRFRFSLESLLTLRSYAAREVEQRLAVATRRCIELEMRIDDCRVRRSRAFQLSRDTGADIELRFAQGAYISHLEQTVSRLTTELEAREKERLVVQREYHEVAKQKKVLEKLKERRADDYYKESMKHDQKDMDEIASGVSARSRIQGGNDGSL